MLRTIDRLLQTKKLPAVTDVSINHTGQSHSFVLSHTYGLLYNTNQNSLPQKLILSEVFIDLEPIYFNLLHLVKPFRK